MEEGGNEKGNEFWEKYLGKVGGGGGGGGGGGSRCLGRVGRRGRGLLG